MWKSIWVALWVCPVFSSSWISLIPFLHEDTSYFVKPIPRPMLVLRRQLIWQGVLWSLTRDWRWDKSSNRKLLERDIYFIIHQADHNTNVYIILSYCFDYLQQIGFSRQGRLRVTALNKPPSRNPCRQKFLPLIRHHQYQNLVTCCETINKCENKIDPVKTIFTLEKNKTTVLGVMFWQKSLSFHQFSHQATVLYLTCRLSLLVSRSLH